MWVGDKNHGVTMHETWLRGVRWSVPAPWETIKHRDPWNGYEDQ